MNRTLLVVVGCAVFASCGFTKSIDFQRALNGASADDLSDRRLATFQTGAYTGRGREGVHENARECAWSRCWASIKDGGAENAQGDVPETVVHGRSTTCQQTRARIALMS
jgi:hypothetical protein